MKAALALALLVFLPGLAFAECDMLARRIPDGDTFYAPTLRVVSPSTSRIENTRFRLKDVYAPEKREPRFAEARADLIALIFGKLLKVEILPDRDPWGGLIVDVYACNGDELVHVNEAMRAKGWTKYGRGVQ